MADETASDGGSARRQARQRLESLRRAGIDRVPRRSADRHPPAPAESAESERSRVGPRAGMDLKPSPGQAPAGTAGPETAAPRGVEAPPPAAARSLFDPGEAPAGPALPAEQRPVALEVIQREVAACVRCPQLAAARTQTVFGEGSPTARLMFIGEAPGADEDRTGRPFVGRAGQLLTDMITKGMGLSREVVYIANVLKCRPPDNRTPLPDEVANCRGYLERQLDIIRPERICLLGKTAAAALLDDVATVPMGKLRGRWFRVQGIRTLVTFHPAYLLRNPAAKREAWEDLKLLMNELGLAIPPR